MKKGLLVLLLCLGCFAARANAQIAPPPKDYYTLEYYFCNPADCIDHNGPTAVGDARTQIGGTCYNSRSFHVQGFVFVDCSKYYYMATDAYAESTYIWITWFGSRLKYQMDGLGAVGNIYLWPTDIQTYGMTEVEWCDGLQNFDIPPDVYPC